MIHTRKINTFLDCMNYDREKYNRKIFKIYLVGVWSLDWITYYYLLWHETIQMDIQSQTTLIDQAQHEIFVHLLPVILWMAVAGVVGVLGNVLTIVFYASKRKWRSSTLQIMSLAIVDLVVCCMIAPNITEMAVNVKFNESVPCKLTHAFGLWAIASSCFILWLIALDRHRKICKPFDKQMTVKTTKRSIVAIVIGSFVLSVRNFVNFTSVEFNLDVFNSNETVRGYYCTTRDDRGYKTSVTIFSAIDFVFVIVCFVTIIVVYSCIIYSLVRLKKKRNESFSPANVCTSIRERPYKNCGMYQPEVPTNDIDSVSHDLSQLNDSDNFTTGFSHSQTIPTITDGAAPSASSLRRTVTMRMNRNRKCKIATRSASERNLTFMMLTVSLLFLVCFIPFFVVKIVMRLALRSGAEFELTVGVQFALKLVYVNSVFNPIVYCVFNPQFRKYIKGILLKCMKCHVETTP